VEVRGEELVAAANWRALWVLSWFLAVYHLGIGKLFASSLPRPPRSWPPTAVAILSPPLVLWGLFCAGMLVRGGEGPAESATGETSIFSNFPFVMLVSGTMLIVTGRTIVAPRPRFLPAGLAVAGAYVLIWMFNGKRSHALIGVLATICAFYIARRKRPSWSMLFATAFMGSLVVAIAIGWRTDQEHARSFAGFASFLGNFQVSKILESLNVADGDREAAPTYESEEYGGYLLMMDTVPDKSPYDHGANYLRIFTTFIPRALWPGKPIYGRSDWINAWIAGSELKREEDFTGPSIGILGATQLNGGAIGALIVVACVAIVLRGAYEYFRLYDEVTWVQFWWAITYYNAWFMVVNDDPLIWFYYNWGVTTFPIVVLMWWLSRFSAGGGAAAGLVQPAA